MKVGDKVKINYRGEPAYRYNRSEDHPIKGFYYENGDEAVVIDPNYYEQRVEEHTNLAGYTFPISITNEGVLVLIDGEQVVVKEKDLEKVIEESEDTTKWYNCPRCDAGYPDQECVCEEKPTIDEIISVQSVKAPSEFMLEYAYEESEE